MAKFAGELLSLNPYLVEGAIDILKQHHRVLSEQLPEECMEEMKLVGTIWQGAGSFQFEEYLLRTNSLRLELLAKEYENLISFLEKSELEVEACDRKLVSTADDLRATYERIIS